MDKGYKKDNKKETVMDKAQKTFKTQKTIIGPTISINGSFRSEEDVAIQGRLEGQVETTADLLVEEDGTLKAEIATRNIDVQGTVLGNVTASDRFEIYVGGTVVGDVRAPRVVLADGAKYKGNIDIDVNMDVRSKK